MNTHMPVPPVTDPSAFCRNELRPLLESDELLRLVAISYRGIAKYNSGLVEFQIPGFQAEVYAGMVWMSDRDLLSQSPADLAQRNARAREEFDRAMRDFKVDLLPGERLLVFIYAGLREYHQSCALAGQIRHDHPEAVIVLTTCDCVDGAKDLVMKGLLDDGTVNHLAVTAECGGRTLMKDMIECVAVARDR